MTDYSWTAERNTMLARLWNTGMSAANIAREMGGVSGNAVIGRARRMKLCYRNPHRVGLSPRDYGQDDRTVYRKPAHKPAKTVSPVRKLLQSLATEPLPANDQAEATVSFNDLEGRHCRAITAEHMPFNADAKIYCGERRIIGAPYCETHARRFMTVPDPAKPKTYWAVGHGKIGGVIRSETEKHKNAKEFAES